MKHPVVEEALQGLLGDQFHQASIWAMTLNQLTERDSTEEVDAVMTKRKRISASGMLTLEDLVDPEDEREVGNAQFKVQTDAEIVAAVRYEEAVAPGDVMEVDSEKEEEDEPEGEPDLTTAEMLSLCQKLEKASLTKGQPDQSMALADHLRRFRANVQREEFLAAKQVTLDDMWGRKANNYRVETQIRKT
ncbi:hypothetical protein B0H14DRAFT_3457083 [Mycena olivaceomarginata]|nr:hypothetical protein B0H14DRAFT_3457083 [Mycena olivaceomarginata]